MRIEDIEETMFKMIGGEIVGNIQCRSCPLIITVKQVTTYIPVKTISKKRRRGD